MFLFPVYIFSAFSIYMLNVNQKCFRGCVNAEKLYPPEVFLKPFNFDFQNFTFRNESEFAGKGHFSVVRKLQLENGTDVAVKQLLSFNKRILSREIQVLKALQDVPNVIKFYGFIGNETKPSMVYSFHSSTKNAYYGNISLDNFRWWLKTALETLAEIHERGIIHKDLKLSNILCDFEQRKLAIIDFGLSDFFRRNSTSNTRVGCIHIKAPELAINMSNYGCAVDMWSLGLSCLDIMIKLRSNWDSKNDEQLIRNFVKSYGSAEWNKFTDKYNPIYKTKTKIHGSFFELAMPGNNELLTSETLDLVKGMMALDPEMRLTAREALKHPFFQNAQS